jgi:hypothetical protein
MRILARLGLAMSLAVPLLAQGAPPTTLKDLAGRVEPSRLSRTVDRLASFGTRHTFSEMLSEKRGIGVASRWLGSELQSLTRIAGSRLVAFDDVFPAEPGGLVAKPVKLINMGVMLPGTDPAREKEALVVVAHYDSRASNPMDGEADAPGAVDNASGVALVLEMATVLATERPAISIYFVATAAGEQGSLGSARLVKRLKGEGVDIVGMVAADCVGNTLNPAGTKSNTAMRIFSDGVPAQETDGQRRVREMLGNENDGPSRELAKYLKRSGERYVEGLDCLAMLRRDRVGRIGEQAAFSQEGFPAVRVTEMTDNYDRQQQNVRSESGHGFGDTATFFDTGYCAKITRMMVTAFTELAYAPQQPQNVGLGGCGTADAKLWWTLPPDPRITGIIIYRRRADGVKWEATAGFPKQESLVLPGVGTDNDVFAVATVDAQGNESLPVSPRSITF